MLPKVKLGRTGMEVTRLGFGAMELRGLIGEKRGPFERTPGRLPNEEHAEKVLNAVLDAGINYVDTSWCYGRSEEFIGKFISQRRSEYYLATKCGHYYRNDPERSGWSREGLTKGFSESLARLQTDHVDLLQLHNPSVEEVKKNGSIETLKEFQAQGLTRFIGISTTLPEIEEFLAMGVFDVFQIPYSAIAPEHAEVISKVAAQGAGTVIRGGVGEGVPAEGTPSRQRYQMMKERWEKSGLEAIGTDMSPIELTLRYTLSHPDIHTTIVGTQNVEHLLANVRAAEKGALEQGTLKSVQEKVAALA